MTTLEAQVGDELAHGALFYRSLEEYLDGTVPFIRAGLAADEPVGVAVPGANLRLILAELGADAGRVTALDMTRVGRNPGRIIAGVLRAFTDAHPAGRVRVVGEPIWPGRTDDELAAGAQHEALINLAFAGCPVSILCPYDAERLDAQVLTDAKGTHPTLIDACGAGACDAYAPERIIAAYNRPPPVQQAPTLTFDRASLADARSFATDQATRLGFGGDYTALELIVGELTANSVVHGGGTGTLAIWSQDRHLVGEVRDAGEVTDPLAGRTPVGHGQLNGRGLLLVNNLADLVRMFTGPAGTTVRFYLAFGERRDCPAAAPAARATQAAGSAPASRAHRLPPSRAPLRWQAQDALRVAARFARYQQSPDDAANRPQDDHRNRLESVLEALAAADVLAQVVELWRDRLVKLARRRGARWTEIGRALGVSKQAAHARYGGTRRRAAGQDLH